MPTFCRCLFTAYVRRHHERRRQTRLSYAIFMRRHYEENTRDAMPRMFFYYAVEFITLTRKLLCPLRAIATDIITADAER